MNNIDYEVLKQEYFNLYNKYPMEEELAFFIENGFWPSPEEVLYFMDNGTWPKDNMIEKVQKNNGKLNSGNATTGEKKYLAGSNPNNSATSGKGSSSGFGTGKGSSSGSGAGKGFSSGSTPVSTTSTSEKSELSDVIAANKGVTVQAPKIGTGDGTARAVEYELNKSLLVNAPQSTQKVDEFVTVTAGTGSMHYTGGGGFKYLKDGATSVSFSVYGKTKDCWTSPIDYAQGTKAMMDSAPTDGNATLFEYGFSMGTRDEIARGVALTKLYEESGEKIPISNGMIVLGDTGSYLDNPGYPGVRQVGATGHLTVEDCKSLADANIGVTFFQHHGKSSLVGAGSQTVAQAQSFTIEELAYAESLLYNGKNKDCAILPKLIDAGVDTTLVDVNWERAIADGLIENGKYHNSTNLVIQQYYKKIYDGDEDAIDPLNNPYIIPKSPVIINHEDGTIDIKLESITSYHDIKLFAPGYYENWLENNNDKIIASDGSIVLSYQAGNGSADKANLFHRNEKENPYTVSASTEGVSIEFQSLFDCVTGIKKTVYSTGFVDNAPHIETASNTSIPAALASNQEALFNASSHLLNDIWSDCAAIDAIANNYQNLDKYLTKKSDLLRILNTDIIVADTLPPYNINFNQTPDLGGNRLELFSASDDYRLMNLSSSDFDGCLSTLKSNFEQDNSDTDKTISSINALLENINNNEGKVWGLLSERLNSYDKILELRKQSNNLLMEAYQKSFEYIQNYMSPYESLKGTDIAILEQRIKAYQAVVDSCENIINAKETVAVKDEAGNITGYKSQYVYSAAVREGAKRTKKNYEDKILECNNHIDKIKGLPAAIKEAEEIINVATLEISNLYVNPVNNIMPLPIIGG